MADFPNVPAPRGPGASPASTPTSPQSGTVPSRIALGEAMADLRDKMDEHRKEAREAVIRAAHRVL
jgi:hypothetical protein